MEFFFGSGSLYGRQTGVNNPTPIRFGAVQDVTIDYSAENKELYGQYQMPIFVARGPVKITGKASFAQLNGPTFNNMFFGEASIGATPVLSAIDEVGTPVANVVTVSQAANFVQDLGVVNLTTGVLMTRVASAPAGTGNYSVNESTGNYTFNSAVTSVSISYDYNGAAGAGTKIVNTNKLMGSAPQFLVVLAGSLAGKAMRMRLNACVASKLSFATKLTDYMMPEFDFSAFADAANNIGDFNFAE
jgi:hypothetical protein